MKLIDTNIFIYAAGKPHPNKQKSIKILEKATENPAGFNISAEILQEILHVYLNKKEREKGIRLVENILKIFPQPFSVSYKDIKESCAFLRDYPELNARDALHAAVVKNYGLEGIISYDKHFDTVKEIKRFEP